jgi:hypothetical protein
MAVSLSQTADARFQRPDAREETPMKSSFPGLLLVSLMCVFPLCAQGQNAVPFLNQPLIPPSVAPGSAGFTLTVNGGNFTANSVVNWNGQPLPTTYGGLTKLTAAVPAANVATAQTANITVSNPAPSAASLPALFPVFNPTSSLTFKQASTIVGYAPVSIAVADYNGDGKPDLAFINYSVDPNTSILVSVQNGNGDGTFTQGSSILQSDPTGDYLGGYILAGDFNNDGKADLAYAASDESLQYIAVATNNGNGTFNAPNNFIGPDENGFDFVIGDFNGDGNLDVANLNYVEAKALFVAFGNGQGGGSNNFEGFLYCCEFYMQAGDFNGDGILDLADSENVLIGDGTGVFSAPQPPYTETDCPFLAADVNGDGIQDLISPGTPTAVFLGNGDGTFTQKAQANALDSCFAVTADFNGDGKLDLASVDTITAAVSIAFGNGDGTFQPPVSYPQASVPSSLALGDFNNDGYLDLAYTSGANVVILLGGAETSRVPTSVRLSSTPDPSKYGEGVTFTAVVKAQTSGVPSGKVTFLDSGQPLSTRLINSTGEASFTIYKLSPGIHDIAAVYGGNSDFMASRSRSHGQLVGK